MAHRRQEFALRFVGVVGFDEQRLQRLVLRLNDLLTHMGFADVQFLVIAGEKTDARRHHEKEVVADQRRQRQGIDEPRGHLIGADEKHGDIDRIGKMQPDKARAVDEAHQEPCIILRVVRRRHESRHGNDAEA